jgi:hypothetical protein
MQLSDVRSQNACDADVMQNGKLILSLSWAKLLFANVESHARSKLRQAGASVWPAPRSGVLYSRVQRRVYDEAQSYDRGSD